VFRLVIIIQFTKEFLLRIIFDDYEEDDDINIISNKIVDTRRWTNEHELIFKHDNKFYHIHYNEPTTKMQKDYGYWKFKKNDEMIDVKEVYPVKKTIIVYE